MQIGVGLSLTGSPGIRALALDWNMLGGVAPAGMQTSNAAGSTITNVAGNIVASPGNTPRFDYDPVTHTCLGLLCEPAATNALLNSLIDGTNLGTQSVTVTAAQRTLSFYGTGTITLSGAAVATVVGTGAYPSRKTYTFTPSAGTLTLTVSGTVQFAQLEAGPVATSFIPTAGAAVTRNAETNYVQPITSMFNKAESTIYAEFVFRDYSGTPQYPAAIALADSLSSFVNSQTIWMASGTLRAFAGTTNANTAKAVSVGAVTKAALAVTPTAWAATANGAAAATGSATSSLATMVALIIGGAGSNPGALNGWVRRVRYYRRALTAAQLQTLTT